MLGWKVPSVNVPMSLSCVMQLPTCFDELVSRLAMHVLHCVCAQHGDTACFDSGVHILVILVHVTHDWPAVSSYLTVAPDYWLSEQKLCLR